MSLPANYKQIAANMPPVAGSPGGHMMSSAVPASFNILKERLRASGSGGGDRNKDTTPIFSHSNHGNPAFTPQKTGKASSKTQADSRAPKPPKAPEKPIAPYMRYSKHVWESVKAANPDLRIWEIGKKIGAMWKAAPETERQGIIDEYEADKVVYREALRVYHTTPEYLAWMKFKAKMRDADVHEAPTRSSAKSQERRIDIQPAEDEDDQDDGCSFKHVAYARFLRNHKLINEIFSEAVVPDVRSVVTTHRMQVLKKQVTSLTMHQTKLEAELQQMEEKFETKKRKMVESSEVFQEELKKHCKPAVDEDTFQKMVVKIYDEMKKERQRAIDDPQSVAGKAGRPEDGKAMAPQQPKQVVGPPKVEASKTEPEPMDIEDSKPPTLHDVDAPKEVKSPEPPKELSPMPEPQQQPPEPQGIPLNPNPPPNVRMNPSPHAVLTPPPPQQSLQPTPPPPAHVPGPPPASVETPPPVPAQNPPQGPPPAAGPPPPHHGPPPHHMPPHMPPHQGMPGHPGLPHPSYGGYPPPGAPTRSPYYPPQYGGHPPPQPYGQYSPYPYHQQYGPPPPGHYMNNRPPMHYPEHGGAPPGQQQPPLGPHEGHHPGYAPPQLGPPPPQGNPIPAQGGPGSVGPPAPPLDDGKSGTESGDSDKKDSE